MAKMVGLSRTVKLQWLNKVVELVLEGLSEQEIKDQLNEYLSFEIESPTNVRKTREILMNIWVFENEQSRKIKAPALDLIKAYPEYDFVVHWCMLMTAYPDFCGYVQAHRENVGVSRRNHSSSAEAETI